MRRGIGTKGAARTRRRLALLTGWILAALGLVVSYGWIAHVPEVLQLRPDWPTMKFNTALCFASIGLGVVALVHDAKRLSLAAAMLVCGVGVATNVEYALGIDLLLDRVILEPFYVESGVPPGRMSPITAGLFTLAGGALALLSMRASPARATVAGVIASVIAGVALAALIGYATRTPTAYGWGAITSVAAHTAAAFLLVAVALGAHAAGSDEKYLPAWLPWAAFIAGFACSLALSLALRAELEPQSRSLIPETAMAIGAVLSVLMAVSLQSRRRLAEQRDLIRAALARREEALAASARAEELTRGVLEAAPDAMIVADGHGRITLLNTMAERVFGYPRSELIGSSIEQLVPESVRAQHARLRELYQSAPTARAMGAGGELWGRRKDGAEFPIDISFNSLQASGRTLVVTTIRDITSRKAAEQRLRDSLEEKELLLKEVHHRVKNNLQVVASMLAIQAEQARAADAREMLMNCRQRVMSLALVHEKLYGGSDLRHIDLGALVRDIAAMLVGAGAPTMLDTKFDVESVIVDIETALPASLIVNELITNAMKHAFIGRSRGELRISVRKHAPDHVDVEVADNGAGGVTMETFERRATLGATIVRRLVRQLGGVLTVGAGEGSSISIAFPIDRRES
ncbi:MAG TPA: PAS domain S-box protein [Steroidobacter sp.]|nr:PAS domain S-box protein [Steroidobacter sp.]